MAPWIYGPHIIREYQSVLEGVYDNHNKPIFVASFQNTDKKGINHFIMVHQWYTDFLAEEIIRLKGNSNPKTCCIHMKHLISISLVLKCYSVVIFS